MIKLPAIRLKTVFGIEDILKNTLHIHDFLADANATAQAFFQIRCGG